MVSMFGTTSASARIAEMLPWVEFTDGVRYLERLLKSPMGHQDVLRLALEGHLIVSVRFLSGVTVQPGKLVPLAPEMIERLPKLDGEGSFTMVRGTVMPGGEKVIRYADEIQTINDVWDLPMLGGERFLVEDMYETLNAREPPELINMEGTFVTDSDGNYFKLMERFEGERRPGLKPYDLENFYPSAGLPEDSVLVLRPQRLREFAAQFAATHPPEPDRAAKPLGNRERTTLLTIVAALAKLANLPTDKPSKAAAIIENQTALMGCRVAARTIENHLKAAAELDHDDDR